MTKEKTPSSVGDTPKQDGEARSRLGWAEPAAWTDRMLTALEKGVKGGKWFSLMDKVYLPRNLKASWEKVKRNRGSSGIDRQSIEKFERHAERYLEEIRRDLAEGNYQPQPVLRRWISKGEKGRFRPLGIPTVKDRIVQTAMRNVLEPIWEVQFSDRSYGFRPGRSAKNALNRVDRLLKAGYLWVVDADIQDYFDMIDHQILMGEVKKEVADGKILSLLERYLNQKVVEGLESWEAIRGTPQGAVISPLLANLYLHPVDQALEEAGYKAVRYADDLVILCRSSEEAVRALSLLKELMAKRKLNLHPEKTRVVNMNRKGGFDFLGYHFEKEHRWPRKRSYQTLKERIRRETKRANGHSLDEVIRKINPILRGWFEYFKHSCPSTFRDTDGWVRMRLRSILRKRSGRRGRGRGKDHQRWPNRYFMEHGLFTMVTAHAAICQSRCGNH